MDVFRLRRFSFGAGEILFGQRFPQAALGEWFGLCFGAGCYLQAVHSPGEQAQLEAMDDEEQNDKEERETAHCKI